MCMCVCLSVFCSVLRDLSLCVCKTVKCKINIPNRKDHQRKKEKGSKIMWDPHRHDLIIPKDCLQNPRWRTTNSEYGKFVITTISDPAMDQKKNQNPNPRISPNQNPNSLISPNLPPCIYPNPPPSSSPPPPANPSCHHHQLPRVHSISAEAAPDRSIDNNRDYNSVDLESAATHHHHHREVDPIHGNVEPVDYVIVCSSEPVGCTTPNQNCSNCCELQMIPPPWNPKPLKPKILFENMARQMQKERQMEIERLLSLPPYKKMKTREWFHDRNPPRKQWQQSPPYMPRHQEENKKYDYYKYYGYGGQGAKTSWGHNLPLGQTPPFSKRIRNNKCRYI